MKNYTDIEQSKKLAEFLPIESADHHYVRKTCDFRGNPVDGKWSEPKYGNPNSKYAHYIVQNFSSYETIPAWSLAALLSVLDFPSLTQNKEDEWEVCVFDHDNNGYIEKTASNPVDVCYEMILKLHKQMIYDFNNDFNNS